MKKIISIALSAIIVLSALCFVSCDSEPELVDTINGMTVKEAVVMALEQLKNESRYRVIVDADVKLNAVITSVSLGSLDNFYENTTDGDNMHYKFTDEDLAFIDNEQIFSLIKDFDKEVWYVDGTRYGISSDGEKIIDDSGDRKPSNVIAKMVDSISASEIESAVAYLDDGETYIIVNVNIEEYNVGATSCKLFLNDDNKLSTAILEGNLYGLSIDLTLSFEYGAMAQIKAPAGFEDAKKVYIEVPEEK